MTLYGMGDSDMNRGEIHCIRIGYYKSEEDLHLELDEIYNAIENNDEEYQLKYNY